MIANFDDFCLYTYATVDDICLQLTPYLKRPGPQPECTDSELISMVLIGECKGWDIETELLSEFSDRADLFPCLPSQSRFNRRRRNLMGVINAIRQIVLESLDIG